MTLKVAIAGVGNCANALIQGVTFYADVDDESVVPGLMHPRFGRYRVRDHRIRRGLRCRCGQGRRRALATRSGPARTTPSVSRKSRPRASSSSAVRPSMDSASTTARSSRSRPLRWSTLLRRSASPERRCSSATCRSGPRMRARYLRAGSTGCRRRVCERPARLHRQRPGVGREVPGRGHPDRRRRHQEPARRNDHAPRARAAVRGARARPRPHLPAQRRRQHGLQEHAGAQAPAVEEDLEDPAR